MNNQKIKLYRIEMFVTNVCNLNCTACDSLSNYQFNGDIGPYSQWESVYRPWAEILDIDQIYLIGGEPMAHADCVNWLKGLRSLWPNSKIIIRTNGTLIGSSARHLNNFYEVCKDYNIDLDVVSHNNDTCGALKEKIYNWLCHPLKISLPDEIAFRKYHIEQDLIKSYQTIKDPSWPECKSLEDWHNLDQIYKNECEKIHNFTFDIKNFDNIDFHQHIVDANGVMVKLMTHTEYNYNMLKEHAVNQTFSVYNSDPVKAHEKCHNKFCHQFYKGKIYKCSFLHAVKDFHEQFYLDINEQDLDLIDSYEAAESTWSIQRIEQFIQNLRHPMPQCKLCSDNPKSVEISATTKKMFFKKKTLHN